MFHETLLSGKTRLRINYWEDPEALDQLFPNEPFDFDAEVDPINQPEYLVSISIQLPTEKSTDAQYSGSSRTSLPVVVHQS